VDLLCRRVCDVGYFGFFILVDIDASWRGIKIAGSILAERVGVIGMIGSQLQWPSILSNKAILKCSSARQLLKSPLLPAIPFGLSATNRHSFILRANQAAAPKHLVAARRRVNRRIILL
jgi:hypothetical protein